MLYSVKPVRLRVKLHLRLFALLKPINTPGYSSLRDSRINTLSSSGSGHPSFKEAAGIEKSVLHKNNPLERD